MRVRFPKAIIQWLLLLVLPTMACNLVHLKTGGTLPRSELTPLDTTGWVAFPGRGVTMGAPSGTWIQVPADFAAAQAQVVTLREIDPSVANVFLELALLANNDFYRLVLMRSDGTAYATVTTRSLRPGQAPDNAFIEAQNTLERDGIVPRKQRSLVMSSGDAVRWTIDVSPTGSQIINRQFQYLLVNNGQLYTFTFSAQLSDFETYMPTFETMALTFRLLP